MKNVCLFLVVIATLTCRAQGGEFRENDNGLIYSDKAITKLKQVVDSLNLKFAVCENKTYRSLPQAPAVYLKVTGTEAGIIKAELEKGAKLKKLKKKFPSVDYKNVYTVRHDYKDYMGENVLHFDFFSSDKSDIPEMDFKNEEYDAQKNKMSGWIYQYYPKSKYTNERITAIYLDKPLITSVLNEKFARMVQYSECLIDTNATVYLSSSKKYRENYASKSNSRKIFNFLTEINNVLARPLLDYNAIQDEIKKEAAGKVLDTIAAEADTDTVTMPRFAPIYEHEKYKKYQRDLEEWERKRLTRVDSMMQTGDHYTKLFNDALEAALKGEEYGTETFEEYVARYSTKENALFLKRQRRVWGTCSMDDSPRRHAMQIAELAGETALWEIFLRSHLDIMNDRFDRVSDGSYAWDARQTYIKELEVLDINVPDLLLGISFRVENPSQNHYYGSIGRLGRSLSESADKAAIEQQMLDIIADDKLDLYNRLLTYNLFENYNYYLKNKAEQTANEVKLAEAALSIPAYARPAERG